MAVPAALQEFTFTVSPSIQLESETYGKLTCNASNGDKRAMRLIRLPQDEYLLVTDKAPDDIEGTGSVGSSTLGVTSWGQRVVVKRQLLDGWRRPSMSARKLEDRLPPITTEDLDNEIDCARMGPEVGHPLLRIHYGKEQNNHDKSLLVIPFLEYSLQNSYNRVRDVDAAALHDVAQQLIIQLIDLQRDAAHCDVKIENVRCHNGRLVLIDYGLSSILNQYIARPTVIAQNQYHNPPQRACTGLTVTDPRKVDVWQLAILLAGLENLRPFDDILPLGSSNEQRLRAFADFEKLRLNPEAVADNPEWQKPLGDFWKGVRNLRHGLGPLLIDMLAYEEEERCDLEACRVALAGMDRPPTPWQVGINGAVKVHFEQAWKALEALTGIAAAPAAEAANFDAALQIGFTWRKPGQRRPVRRRQPSLLSISVSPRQRTLAYAVCIGVLGAIGFAGCAMTPIFFFVPFAAAPICFWGAAAVSLLVGSAAGYRAGRT